MNLTNCMIPLLFVMSACSLSASAASTEGNDCAVDTGNTECPSLLQTSSAAVSKAIAEEVDEDSEDDDASFMRSDDNHQAMDQFASAPLTCSQEETIRESIAETMKIKARRSARIIRLIFHDAIDANNLLSKNNETGKWEPLEGTYGGVDDCLYSPLSEGDKGFPEPSHNKNLGGISVEYSKLCNQLCTSDAYAKTKLCADRSNCVVDLKVLGALVTVEKVGGPRIPMTWGRKKGKCTTMVVSKDKTDVHPALRFAPSLTALDDPDSFRTAFDRLGFSPTDHAALMGAHTFGKLAVCAGGLNGIEKGNWCNNPTKLDPPLETSNFAPWSVPQKGPCTPVYGKVGGGVSNGCWAKTGGGDLAPVYAFKNSANLNGSTSRGFGRGLGDGGFFDRTPETFDNDYYKLFAESTFDGKDVCCGKMKKGHCDRAKGTPMRITKRNAAGRGVQAERVPGGECAIDWCRDDRKIGKGKGKTHMKSTRAWAEASHDFVKKGYQFGVTKRMIRLAGDWALLGNDDTRAAVKLFAKDQSAFFKAFAVAFTKVINKGYKDLVPCSGGSQAASKPSKPAPSQASTKQRKGKGGR